MYPWSSYQIRKITSCACAGNAGNVFPAPRVSDPDTHHGTCVTHVPWCMTGSLTSGFLWSRWRENVPGISGACATRNFTYLVRGPLRPMIVARHGATTEEDYGITHIMWQSTSAIWTVKYDITRSVSHDIFTPWCSQKMTIDRVWWRDGLDQSLIYVDIEL